MWYVCTTNDSREQNNQSFYLDLDLALERARELVESGYRVVIEEDISYKHLIDRVS